MHGRPNQQNYLLDIQIHAEHGNKKYTRPQNSKPRAPGETMTSY